MPSILALILFLADRCVIGTGNLLFQGTRRAASSYFASNIPALPERQYTGQRETSAPWAVRDTRFRPLVPESTDG